MARKISVRIESGAAGRPRARSLRASADERRRAGLDHTVIPGRPRPADGDIAVALLINVLLYFAAFRALTPGGIGTRELLPGATVASLGFSLLITVGAGLVQHQIRHSSTTYGQFGIVIGLVGFLFLLAEISLYGAELNPVLARHLWPRAIVSTDPTPADDQVLRDITHQNLRRTDQRIGVGFGEDASDEAALDARARPDGPSPAKVKLGEGSDGG
jgi:hypothetical protein